MELWGDVYYHSVKQDWLADEDSISEKDDPDINNIARTSKITRSGRVFSLEISPLKTVTGPVIIPAFVPVDTTTTVPMVTPTDTPTAESIETRGKGILVEPVWMKAQSLSIPEASKKEMEEILKIIKRSDYNVVEQLGKTPSKISMLALLLCSKAHAKALVKFLKTAHVSQETSADQFQGCVASLTADNGLGFSDADLTPRGRKRNEALCDRWIWN